MICNNNNNNKNNIESRVRHRMTSSDTSDEHSSGFKTISTFSFHEKKNISISLMLPICVNSLLDRGIVKILNVNIIYVIL